MTLPNFLIIGAAKSGTTALHNFLSQHPEIFMSEVKELRYFSYLSSPPPLGLPKKYIHTGVINLDEYKMHFSKVNTEKIIGESSPMYLYYPGTAEEIKATLPNVKMLAILRNPIDRAFSAYMHAIRDWLEPSNSFTEALNRENERINAGWGILWHYTKAGFYYKQLRRYYDIFKEDQIKIVLYDDLVSDAQILCKEIFQYLDVDITFLPKTTNHPNVSGLPKNLWVHRLMEKLFQENNLVKQFSRKIFTKSLRKNVMINIRKVNLKKREMPESIRKDLQEIFFEDIKNLENLIKRDLSKWLL